MALGGGSFVSKNKILPGAYVNFISLSQLGAAISERGAAAFPFELDWGKENEVFSLTNDEFIKNSKRLFGYDYYDKKMKGFREIFRNARVLHGYRLGINSKRAACEFGTAKYGGIRGNDLSVVISKASPTSVAFTVKLFLDGVEVDSQNVASLHDIGDNDFVVWKKEAALSINAGVKFTGGANDVVDIKSYQWFLDIIQNYSFNTIGVCSCDPDINELLVQFTKNMRDNMGVKFQGVVFNQYGDHEGVINVCNFVDSPGDNSASLTYWVTGLIAGCPVNKSVLNRIYDGECEIRASFTQMGLSELIRDGRFALHRVGDSLRVLADVNSLTSLSEEKGEVFRDNQTIRVVDQIANDIAVLFNEKYIGNVTNDESGRISFWADIVKHHENLAQMRAIENFSDEDVEVLAGDDKRSVLVKDKINIVNAMAQVYMTCIIA